MKTAARESVMETIVNPISFVPLSAASNGSSPFSMCRTMFSRTTIASSTTNPTDNVSAMRDRLSMLYPRTYIAANVPAMDSGSARDGMTVAERLRRNRKMTRTTSASVSQSVNFTSATDSRIDCERS